MHKDNYLTIIKHAKNSESESKLNSMIKLAQSEPGIAISINELDANPYLFNCANATIDLRIGKALKHSRKNLITKISNVKYDIAATCPLWMSFLIKITNGNPEMLEFLQRAVGYTLTGDTSEQCMFILHGSGANGKSTFIEILKLLFGDYAKVADSRAFLTNQSNAIRNDLARLNGARFVSSSEADEGSKLSESVIKQFTGSDTITARFLYQEAFEFKPVCKIFLATNYKPVINGDYAIWRRIRLIPFNVTIPKEEQDPDLIEKLKGELSGILNWAIEGCLKWQSLRLGIPKAISDATSEYKEEMDIISDFISDCCVLTPNGKVATKDLFSTYQTWCRETSIKAESKRTFSDKIAQKGFIHARIGKNGNKGYEGLILADLADS